MKLFRLLNKLKILSILYVVFVVIAYVLGFRLNSIGKQRLFYQAVMNDMELISQVTTNQELDETELLTQFSTSDIRIANLKYFFRKYGSVLYDHAEVFVKMADKYSIDYRLLPAIAMQESNLCKYIYEGSHNCWGWGIYGNKVTRFSSYPEAIETISKGIKLYYVDKGLTTPEAIMRKYTPPSDGSWAFGVNTFLKSIE